MSRSISVPAGRTATPPACRPAGPPLLPAWGAANHPAPASLFALQGLSEQCKAVRGNFLEMPFEAATFDGAYAMEATCHAPKLEQVCAAAAAAAAAAHTCRPAAAAVPSPLDTCCWPAATAAASAVQRQGFGKLSHGGVLCVNQPHACHAPPGTSQVYGEVFRVLKPGAVFMTYECVGEGCGVYVWCGGVVVWGVGGGGRAPCRALPAAADPCPRPAGAPLGCCCDCLIKISNTSD